MKIGKRIQELRKENDLSQEDLASLLGVARQTISKWELGETSPDLKQAKKLSEIFKVTLDELSGEKQSKDKVNQKGNTLQIIGLIFIDIFVFIFFIFMLLWILVLGIFSIAMLLLSICLFFNINFCNLIPYIPYHCKVLLGVTTLALTVLSVIGTSWFIGLTKKLFKMYKKYHHKVMTNSNDEIDISLHTPIFGSNKKKLKTLTIITLIVFIIFLIISLITCMITSGNIAFYHEWNWFIK